MRSVAKATNRVLDVYNIDVQPVTVWNLAKIFENNYIKYTRTSNKH